MRKFTILLFSLCVIMAYNIKAQEIRFDSLSSVSSRGDYTSYVSKDGLIFKVGDTLKIGTPYVTPNLPYSNNTFKCLFMTIGILYTPTPLTIEFSGSEAEIKKIQVAGSKKLGYAVFFITKGNIKMVNYKIMIEGAIATGEIRTVAKTSDEALAELRKAKDKLDLGLITQEDYNNIKTDLSKYIK